MAQASLVFNGSSQLVAANTAQQCQASGAARKFGSVEFRAYKADGSANTGTVLIGFGSSPGLPLAAGDSWSISVDPKNNATLADVWIKGANIGDGVIWNGAEI